MLELHVKFFLLLVIFTALNTKRTVALNSQDGRSSFSSPRWPTLFCSALDRELFSPGFPPSAFSFFLSKMVKIHTNYLLVAHVMRHRIRSPLSRREMIRSATSFKYSSLFVAFKNSWFSMSTVCLWSDKLTTSLLKFCYGNSNNNLRKINFLTFYWQLTAGTTGYAKNYLLPFMLDRIRDSDSSNTLNVTQYFQILLKPKHDFYLWSTLTQFGE